MNRDHHSLDKTVVMFLLLFCNDFMYLYPSGLPETGPQEGVVAAGVCVVEEVGEWAEETALTPV